MASDQLFCSQNRSFSKSPDQYDLESISERLQYTGYRHHKRNPKDFDIDLSKGRDPDRTLCDPLEISCRDEAISILKEGIKRGLISEEFSGDFPDLIWSVVDDQHPVEARITNEVQGIYHGYPLQHNDAFREKVLDKWD